MSSVKQWIMERKNFNKSKCMNFKTHFIQNLKKNGFPLSVYSIGKPALKKHKKVLLYIYDTVKSLFTTRQSKVFNNF